MKILSLDVATKTGWAVDDGKKMQSGTVDFKNGQWDGAGIRFIRCESWLYQTIQKHHIQIIVYEAVEAHGGGIYSAHVYGGFVACIQSICEDMMVPYHGVAVGTIKKSFTGRGNANKDDMIKECFNRGHNPRDDNEADAIAIAYLARELFPRPD